MMIWYPESWVLGVVDNNNDNDKEFLLNLHLNNDSDALNIIPW